MSSSRKKQLSYVLLLCMAFIIFPMNALHGHETEEAPCDDHFELAVDSCHISIYHNASEIEHCDHKEHLVDSEDECELCDFVLSRKIDFEVQSTDYALAIATKQSNSNLVCQATLQKYDAQLQGRAPPVTYQG